ncbi:response regulator transcription factor [Pedobacter nyackensis]|uniref:response regulator transcription factor n=1 Tax=Pedobacter nyackensis TaxID=475255 RepID=UPI002930A04B|nr:response regulator transcription factor [Pedobacter nyackensis]
MTKKIVICDDHILFSSGLTELLKKNNSSYDIISFNESISCKHHLQQQQADIFICDLNIDNIDGFILINEIRKELKETKVIILTAYYEDFLIQKAEKAGIHAFLKKETEAKELISVIEMSTDAPFYTNKEVKRPSNLFQEIDLSVAGKFKLSGQEKQIIRLIIEGKTSKEIADKLFISKTTVDTHRRNINRKLEIGNSASLIKFANENNLFS